MKSSSVIETKHLYKFLRKHCCLEKCIKNILDYEKRLTTRLEWVAEYKKDGDVLKLLSNYTYLSNMFVWLSTDEGAAYWMELDKTLRKEIAERTEKNS